MSAAPMRIKLSRIGEFQKELEGRGMFGAVFHAGTGGEGALNQVEHGGEVEVAGVYFDWND